MKQTTETKPVSFRLPTEVFDALQSKGQAMELSAHELAAKIVQEHHQAPVDGVTMQQTVSSSKQLVATHLSKRVCHLTYKEYKTIFFAACGGNLPHSVQHMEVGMVSETGLKRLGEDLWEIEVEPLTAHFK